MRNRDEDLEIKLMLDFWDKMGDETKLFVPMYAQKTNNTFVIFAKKEEKSDSENLIIPAFLSLRESDSYCKKHSEVEIVSKRISAKTLCGSLNNIYKKQGTKMKCILTSISADGKLYQLETLWTFLNN